MLIVIEMLGPHQHVHKLGFGLVKNSLRQFVNSPLMFQLSHYFIIAAVVNENKTSLTTNIDCPAVLEIYSKTILPIFLEF